MMMSVAEERVEIALRTLEPLKPGKCVAFMRRQKRSAVMAPPPVANAMVRIVWGRLMWAWGVVVCVSGCAHGPASGVEAGFTCDVSVPIFDAMG